MWVTRAAAREERGKGLKGSRSRERDNKEKGKNNAVGVLCKRKKEKEKELKKEERLTGIQKNVNKGLKSVLIL